MLYNCFFSSRGMSLWFVLAMNLISCRIFLKLINDYYQKDWQIAIWSVQFSSVTQSCPTLRPHESQHARPPYPSPTLGVYSNSCPSSWWCHPAISSSVVPFSSCPQSLPTSGSFPISQLLEFQLSDKPANSRLCLYMSLLAGCSGLWAICECYMLCLI